jgi:hypothetical protein
MEPFQVSHIGEENNSLLSCLTFRSRTVYGPDIGRDFRSSGLDSTLSNKGQVPVIPIYTEWAFFDNCLDGSRVYWRKPYFDAFPYNPAIAFAEEPLLVYTN